jgi:hypothetical protein
MLDSVHVADCNLTTLYLIACNLTANLYNVTKSAQMLHGGRGRGCQLSQVIEKLESVNKMDCITVVGSDESYSDGNVQVWNGNNMLLHFLVLILLFLIPMVLQTLHSIPKLTKRGTTMLFCIGFCASSFNDSHYSNGVHHQNVRSNTTGCPHIGSQLLASHVSTDKRH